MLCRMLVSLVKHEESVGSDLVNSSLEMPSSFSWLETARLGSWCFSCSCGWLSRAEKYWKIFCRPPQTPPARWWISGNNFLQLSDIGKYWYPWYPPPTPQEWWGWRTRRWCRRWLWRGGRSVEAEGSSDIWSREQQGLDHWRGNRQNQILRAPLLV